MPVSQTTVAHGDHLVGKPHDLQLYVKGTGCTLLWTAIRIAAYYLARQPSGRHQRDQGSPYRSLSGYRISIVLDEIARAGREPHRVCQVARKSVRVEVELCPR